MIRVGIGGWTFAPWRGTFYPEGLKHADELKYAGEHLTTIEINGTFYRTQSAKSFAKWRDETPDGFVFALKGHRAVVNKKVLAEAGEGIDVVPQFGAARTRRQARAAAVAVRAVQALRRRRLRRVPQAAAEGERRPAAPPCRRGPARELPGSGMRRPPAQARRRGGLCRVRRLSGDRRRDRRLRLCAPAEDRGVDPDRLFGGRDLDRFAKMAKTWAAGGEPDDLPRFGSVKAKKAKRDVFVYMISGAKVRAPAAAMALIERVG